MKINALDKIIVNSILTFIQKIQCDLQQENAEFGKSYIRDDIFTVLSKYGIVVFYPLPDDTDINGYNIDRILRGETKKFIFINTANPTEKQVFAAAHELGHVLNVVEQVKRDCAVEYNSAKVLDPEIDEHIVNRFAAEFLMPKTLFIHTLQNAFKEIELSPESVPSNHLIRIIVSLMNAFLCTYKSVVVRLFEVDMLKKEAAEELLSIEADLEPAVKMNIQRCNYSRLNVVTNKKSITGLVEMLEYAENNETVPESMIDGIRNQFDLNIAESQNELNSISHIKLNKEECND